MTGWYMPVGSFEGSLILFIYLFLFFHIDVHNHMDQNHNPHATHLKKYYKKHYQTRVSGK